MNGCKIDIGSLYEERRFRRIQSNSYEFPISSNQYSSFLLSLVCLFVQIQNSICIFAILFLTKKKFTSFATTITITDITSNA